jgi:putative exporter of polyketide antibiotics
LLHALEVTDTTIKALKYSIECQKDFMAKEAIRLQKEEKMLLIEKLKASNLDQKIILSSSLYMVLAGAIILTCTFIVLVGRVG